MIEQSLERGLDVVDGVLDGVEVGLDFEDELGEGAAVVGGERLEQGHGLLLEGAAAGGDVGQVRDEVAGARIGTKTELIELVGDLGLELDEMSGFVVGHGW